MKYLRYLIPLVLVVGAITAFFVVRSRRANADTIEEVVVERGDLTISVRATGTVQPENRLEIKPPIAGRIDEVLVKEGQKVRKGQLLAWMSSTERAALLDSARSKGPEEVKRWEELYRPTPVVAPINGMIILRNVEAGQTFSNTDAILVMSDRLTVKAQVDETDLAQIKLGQAAVIDLDAYPGKKTPAKVDQIAYESKTVNNVTNYVVDVLPESTPEYMRSGMTANVSFDVDTRENVLVINTEAIKTSKSGPKVKMRDANGEIVDRQIKLGITDGKQTEVVEGLKEGEIALIIHSKSKPSEAGSSLFGPQRPKSQGQGKSRGSAGGPH